VPLTENQAKNMLKSMLLYEELFVNSQRYFPTYILGSLTTTCIWWSLVRGKPTRTKRLHTVNRRVKSLLFFCEFLL